MSTHQHSNQDNHDLRVDWITRQKVGIAQTIAANDGTQAAARYMAHHLIPLRVALRTLAGRK